MIQDRFIVAERRKYQEHIGWVLICGQERVAASKDRATLEKLADELNSEQEPHAAR